MARHSPGETWLVARRALGGSDAEPASDCESEIKEAPLRAMMSITDLPDDVLTKILTMYLDSISYRDWANRKVVDLRPYEMFRDAAELLMP